MKTMRDYIETARRLDEAASLEKFWYNPQTGEDLWLPSPGEHMAFLTVMGIPQDEIDAVKAKHVRNGYVIGDMDDYWKAMLGLARSHGWARGGVTSRSVYIETETVRQARKTLKWVLDSRLPKSATITVKEPGKRAKAYRLRDQEEMAKFVRFGTAGDVIDDEPVEDPLAA